MVASDAWRAVPTGEDARLGGGEAEVHLDVLGQEGGEADHVGVEAGADVDEDEDGVGDETPDGPRQVCTTKDNTRNQSVCWYLGAKKLVTLSRYCL